MARKPPANITRSDALQMLIYLSGYSAREISLSTGLARNTLDNGIKGTYQLSDDAIRKVARFFNVLPERLVAIPRDRNT